MQSLKDFDNALVLDRVAGEGQLSKLAVLVDEDLEDTFCTSWAYLAVS